MPFTLVLTCSRILGRDIMYENQVEYICVRYKLTTNGSCLFVNSYGQIK